MRTVTRLFLAFLLIGTLLVPPASTAVAEQKKA